MWTLFGDFGYRLRAGGGGRPLVGRAADAAAGGGRGDVLPRLHVLQPHGRGFEGLHPARVAVGVDLQVGLSLVFLQLSVVGVGHPALVQAFVLFPHFGDLQLVGDVVALDFHCLKDCRDETKRKGELHEMTASPSFAPSSLMLENGGVSKATARELAPRGSAVKRPGLVYPGPLRLASPSVAQWCHPAGATLREPQGMAGSGNGPAFFPSWHCLCLAGSAEGSTNPVRPSVAFTQPLLLTLGSHSEGSRERCLGGCDRP